MRGNSWLAEVLLASQEGLFSMELVTWISNCEFFQQSVRVTIRGKQATASTFGAINTSQHLIHALDQFSLRSSERQQGKEKLWFVVFYSSWCNFFSTWVRRECLLVRRNRISAPRLMEVGGLNIVHPTVFLFQEKAGGSPSPKLL
jgi:hypothetical protein